MLMQITPDLPCAQPVHAGLSLCAQRIRSDGLTTQGYLCILYYHLS